FYKWLADEEMKTNMKYVVSYTKNCSSFKSVMFCCNRSGKYKSTVDDSSLKNTLSKHLVTVHNIRSESNLPVECREQDCIEKFKNISHLRNHLCEKHNLENFGKSHELEFMESSGIILQVAADEEMKTNMKYVVSYTKNCSSFKSVMFCCNRSGKYKSTVDDSSLKNTLSKHLVTVHNIRSESNLPVECQEQDCIEKFKNISHLRNHLCEKHNLENFGKSHALEFMESSEFYKWLADEEMKTNMKYVVSYTKNCSSFKSVMFCCNRSGKYKSTVDERERQLKAQGTKKMGFHCTSSILLKDYGNRLAATYFEEHYKHDAHLCHIPIPKFEKEVIAEKIMSGVQEKRILEDIRQ
ncbi:unnamed protein product, partial [Larinioides sclopetarius]